VAAIGTIQSGKDGMTGCGNRVTKQAFQCRHGGMIVLERAWLPNRDQRFDDTQFQVRRGILLSVMNLTAGTRLGPYETVAHIGAGGMGEVYRARDTRLGRDVAIKTSKRTFDDRFQREAHAIAALNHPNVCTLYDVGPDYLVMEYVEGQSLSERIREGALPEPEAMAAAMQIAAALEAAHEKGIVHRDLKPANIKIKPDGQVKVLDFGLAKVTSAVDSSGGDPENSPTFTGQGGTAIGVVLGTAAYMAPEQARSQAVDKRADIWAFGVVLWEMVTGRRPFQGDTASDSIAAVLKDDPAWEEVPQRLRPLLRRCLEKDPRRRLHDIADARLWLEESPHTTTPPPLWRAARLMLAAGVLCLVASIAGVGLMLWRGSRSPAHDQESIQFSITAPTGTRFTTRAAVSPNGRSIVFVAASATSENRLYLHDLGSASTRPVAGTEGAEWPFWAPDNRSVAFTAGGKLKRIAVDGGPPIALCDASPSSAGVWGRGGYILLGFPDGLWRIPDSGGSPERITTVDGARGEIHHGSPQFLPDGRRFLYYIMTADPKTRGMYLGSIDDKGAHTLVMATSNKVLYAPASPGTPEALLFVREQALQVQPFDSAQGRLIGSPSIIADSIARAGGANQNAEFWMAPSGLLVFRKSDLENEGRLLWISRAGARLEELPRRARFSSFFLSPDERRLAVDVRNEDGMHDIWLYDFARNTMIKQTGDPGNDFLGVWSPDGQRLIFGSSRTGFAQLYLTTPGGGAPEQIITDGPIRKYPLQWTRDGKLVLFRGENVSSAIDELWALTVDGDRKPFRVIAGAGSQFTGQISPDGRWIAYQSTETGTNEVYVQRFPVSAGRVAISSQGGRWPKWRADGKELYYISGSNGMMAVALDPSADDLAPGPPKELFRTALPETLTYPYDVSGNGERFLVLERIGQQSPQLDVLTNWRSRMK
jgi:serine/threonine protein kinase